MYKRQDEEDCRELKEFSERIKRHLEENGDGEVSVPDIHPYREYHGVPMKPKADKNCIKCGKCAAECPVQAIPKDNPSSLDKERCISCMHCIAICPEQARQMCIRDRLCSREQIERVLSEQNVHIETEFRHYRSAEWLRLEIHQVAVKDGKPRTVILAIRDINKEKQRELEYYEEEKRAKQALEEAYESVNQANRCV